VVAVGRLFGARGIRGELTGEIYSPAPGRAEKLKDVVLELEGGKTRRCRVEEVWWHGGRPVFKFVGIDSMSDAEVKVGTVGRVEDYGGGPLLEVKLEDGRDVLVPFSRAICKEIDVAGKSIRAEVPEGLLDK
jgi:ribosomal 30S subunit maturation factor RimM